MTLDELTLETSINEAGEYEYVRMNKEFAEHLLDLVKAQEPKTVLYREDGEYCPQCSTMNTRAMGVQRLHRGTRYCPYCGQGLIWE